jgi:hypothetical protein
MRVRYRIADAEDPFERMLAVLRFTFSKDLRHAVSCSSSYFGILVILGIRLTAFLP